MWSIFLIVIEVVAIIVVVVLVLAFVGGMILGKAVLGDDEMVDPLPKGRHPGAPTVDEIRKVKS